MGEIQILPCSGYGEGKMHERCPVVKSVEEVQAENMQLRDALERIRLYAGNETGILEINAIAKKALEE